jgi:hypothetical protein
MANNQNNFLYLLLAFAAGFLVGANWPQIKTKVAPLFNTGMDKFGDLYAQLAQIIGEQKEAFDDSMAEKKAGPQKKANGKPSGAAQAEFVANLAQMMAGANQAEIVSNLSQIMAGAGSREKAKRSRPRKSSPKKRTVADAPAQPPA